jgi:predicted amidohydrolase YtcJ
MKRKADLIIYNTLIYTLDSLNSQATCLAIADGKIIAVGTDAEVRSRYWSKNSINGKKMVVYPGFIDAHSHFTGYAQYLRYADLSNASSYKELIGIISDYHKNNKGSIIIGRGWDQNKWPEKKFPNYDELNRLFPEIPVILTRIDGHAVLVNEAACKKAGLQIPYPVGEAILENGKVTGVFLEGTADRLKAIIGQPADDEMSVLLSKAASLCFEAGLTGVNDAGIDKEMILLIDSLQQAGKLKMRIDAMINPTDENMDYFMPGGGYRSPFLRVGSVKIYADGALGSRGACLLHSYSDDSNHRGIMVTTPAQMKKICERARLSGFQVNTHAIGDSAVRWVLHTYAQYLKGPNDMRWRIEHAQVVHENDFELFGQFSVIPSVQATHATSDMSWAKARLGNYRLKNSYAYKKLMLQNGWIANGTDFPVEDISPLATFYAAVARKDKEGQPKEGFLMENSLDRPDALRSITIWAAKSAFEESYRGSIEVDKYADLVILDKDLLTCKEQEILEAQVLYTIINGEIVHKK